MSNTRVFISYGHDSEAHREKALGLFEHRADSIELPELEDAVDACITVQKHESPRETIPIRRQQ